MNPFTQLDGLVAPLALQALRVGGAFDRAGLAQPGDRGLGGRRA